jgi:hypothetical protein
MQSQQLVNGNIVLGKAGLTGLSGAATTFTTAVALVFALAGKAFSKAAVAGGATPTTDAYTGKTITIQPGKGSVVLWCFDATGAVKLVQGSSENIDDAGNFLQAPPQMYAPGDDLVPFAYSIHKNLSNGGANVTPFNVGTSLWNTANSVHTVQDIITLPGRPQQS